MSAPSTKAPTAAERSIARPPTSSRTMTYWTTDDLDVAESLAQGGDLRRAAELCWSLLGDGRVLAALTTRVKGLLRLPISWDKGSGRSSGRVARALEEGDFYDAHSEAALCSLAMWGILLGVGIAQREWVLRGDRWLGVLRPFDARNLRWVPRARQWVVRTDAGDVVIAKGDRRWVLYAPTCSGDPDGDEMPWAYGAWRACKKAWLGKDFAWGDMQHHLEVHGSPIRVADAEVGANAPTTAACTDAGNTLADIGGNAALVLAPGLKARLLEATAKTWEMFPAAIDLASREIVVAITGQTSSTEPVQGQDTGATLHGRVRQDLIDADAQTLSTTLREQCLVDYAAINFGAHDLAPWPHWKTEPPADIGARGEAMTKLGAGITALDGVAPDGKRLDRAALFEAAGVPLEDIPAPPPRRALPVLPAPVPPPPPRGHRAHGAHRHDTDLRAESNTPALNADLPFWRFNVVDDDRGPCSICDGYRGVEVRAETAWWNSHTPPLHFNCRCYLTSHAEASGTPRSQAELARLPQPDAGFGDGRIPLDDEGLRVEDIILALAVIVGIAILVFGRPPRDGGTGRAYNPKLPEPGACDPGRWIEIGAGVTMASGAAWAAWDDATEDARIEATLAFQRALYDGAETEAAAIATALESPALSAGARKILESMRDGARFTVPAADDEE